MVPFAFAVLAAGCLQEVPHATPAPTAGGQDFVPPVLDKILFEGCLGVALGTEVPADTLLDDVPHAFGPASTVPFLAYVGATALHCPRLVAHDRTFVDAALLWTYVSVVPADDSWTAGGRSYYTLSVDVTEPDLAAPLRDAGLDPQVARLERSHMAGTAQAAVHRWTFTDAGGSVSLTFPHDGTRGATYDAVWHHWTGQDPFHRVDVRHQDENSQTFHLNAGRLETSGQGPLARALSLNPAPAYGASIQSLNWELDSKPETFGTKEDQP